MNGYEDDDELVLMRAKAFADEAIRERLANRPRDEPTVAGTPLLNVPAIRGLVHDAISSTFFIAYRTGALDATEPRVKRGLTDPMRRRRR